MRTPVNKKHAKYVLSQLSIAITLLMSIELFYYFFPKYIPQNILLEMPLDHIAQAIGNDPRKKVMKLEGNPWVKFKPNNDIYDYQKEGEVASYVQKWRTDSLGFKNDPSVLGSGNIDVIMLGDSHVEGFGTSPRQTMTGVLNFKHSIIFFNLCIFISPLYLMLNFEPIILCLFLILVLGISHGALDNIKGKKLLKLFGYRSSFSFYLVYILISFLIIIPVYYVLQL